MAVITLFSRTDRMFSLNMRFLSLILIAFVFSTGCDSSNGSSNEGDLVIHDITIGTGEVVGNGITVIVSYIGTLEDGTIFDSSELRGEDLIFTPGANNVIPGLDQGVPGMRVGGRRRIEIPSHLAFGRNGFCITDDDCPVPSNADVVFDVTIVDILDFVLVEEVKIGSGEEVIDGDRVRIQYAVALQNGNIVDSSVDDSYLEFTIGTEYIIPGLHEGVNGMRVGGIRSLTVPPVLAYGEFGDLTGVIPPFAVLLFRVDLIEKVDRDGS